MTYRFRFSAFQSLVSVLPKPLYLFLMLRFVGIKVFDKVCLVSPFLVLPCKFARQHILLLGICEVCFLPISSNFVNFCRFWIIRLCSAICEQVHIALAYSRISGDGP